MIPTQLKLNKYFHVNVKTMVRGGPYQLNSHVHLYKGAVPEVVS